MMLCCKCKSRPAVVFVTRTDGKESRNEGFCLTCAKELGIKPVNDMLEKFGINDEDMEQMEQQMAEMMSTMEGDEEGFSPGGAAPFPFLQNVFGPDGRKETDKEGNPHKNDHKNNSQNRKRSFLEMYCNNLTAKAREGHVDPTIGRDREIYRVTQILSRRTKNNPCLIGEPGVGKTAIAEGLASRIASGDVPPHGCNS